MMTPLSDLPSVLVSSRLPPAIQHNRLFGVVSHVYGYTRDVPLT